MKKYLFLFIFLLPAAALAQGSMAVAPARFELEMKPGSETTVVLSVDYKNPNDDARPMRLTASLNDWTMTQDGQVQFFPAGTRQGSASSWMIYSPGEAAVAPGMTHQIRVTVSVPVDTTPGDHLAALIVEERPDNTKPLLNSRQVIVRYRMASVFYIKVPGVTRKGALRDLFAASDPNGIVVKPFLANEGNSVVRPTASVSITDSDGKPVAEVAEVEGLPVLGASETAQLIRIDKQLPIGKYTVKYRVDFQTGQPVVEGVTEFIVSQPQIASKALVVKKP